MEKSNISVVPDWMMGFPPAGVEDVLMDIGQAQYLQLSLIPECATTHPNADNVTTSTPGQSVPSKQRSQSAESSTSTHSVKKSDCWYTPAHIVEKVVQVLLEIDLDPCADDGKHIPAQLHYTAPDDGLSREWHGRVFINPPYSCPGKWMKKLQAEVDSGRVSSALALVPAATDTNWLSPVLKTQPVCFWKGRIKFLDTNYQPKLSARQSHVLVYWGENWQKFREVFSEYGVVYMPIPLQGDSQTQSSTLLSSTHSNTQLSNDNQVLGGNKSPSIPPSTQEQGNNQTHSSSLLSSTHSNTQLSRVC